MKYSIFILFAIFAGHLVPAFAKTDPTRRDQILEQEFRMILTMDGAERFFTAFNRTAKSEAEKISLKEAQKIKQALQKVADASGSACTTTARIIVSSAAYQRYQAMCLAAGFTPTVRPTLGPASSSGSAK